VTKHDVDLKGLIKEILMINSDTVDIHT